MISTINKRFIIAMTINYHLGALELCVRALKDYKNKDLLECQAECDSAIDHTNELLKAIEQLHSLPEPIHKDVIFIKDKR